MKNIKAGWRGAGIYPIDPSKVLQKLPQATPQSTRPSTPNTTSTIPAQPITAENLFNILPDGHSVIDATTLHAATTVLNDLVRTKQALHTPARKFIPRLASTTERLLAENAILKLELQQTKAVLGSRKVRASGKRLVLKGKIVISTDEILKAIEEAEAATQAKTGRPRGRPRTNAPTGRPRGRPHKNAPAVPIVTVVEVQADDGGSESDPDL